MACRGTALLSRSETSSTRDTTDRLPVLFRVKTEERRDSRLEKVAQKGAEEFVYSSPNIIRMITSESMRWLGHVARMWETKTGYNTLVRNRESKRQLGRPKHRQ
jgi:hypothetical protein